MTDNVIDRDIYIVRAPWGGEGVFFEDQKDAEHAAGIRKMNPASTVADDFRERHSDSLPLGVSQTKFR